MTSPPRPAPSRPPPPKEDSFFTTTNVQLLWGGGFSDAQLGYFTKTQSMTTLTLNNFTQFKYGDSFFFVDMYQGDFVDGSNAKIYAEWHPRILINKFIDPKAPPAFGVIGNWGVGGEINVGNNFSAYLVGPSVDLFLPWNIYVGMAFYYRYSRSGCPRTRAATSSPTPGSSARTGPPPSRSARSRSSSPASWTCTSTRRAAWTSCSSPC